MFRSLILVCLILFLMRSFCSCRCSGFDHQIGRRYSHLTQRLMQAVHAGCFSSHFFRRRRQVKHPGARNGQNDPRSPCAIILRLEMDLPDRDLLCRRGVSTLFFSSPAARFSQDFVLLLAAVSAFLCGGIIQETNEHPVNNKPKKEASVAAKNVFASDRPKTRGDERNDTNRTMLRNSNKAQWQGLSQQPLQWSVKQKKKKNDDRVTAQVKWTRASSNRNR